jgi:hypothetical protein
MALLENQFIENGQVNLNVVIVKSKKRPSTIGSAHSQSDLKNDWVSILQT